MRNEGPKKVCQKTAARSVPFICYWRKTLGGVKTSPGPARDNVASLTVAMQLGHDERPELVTEVDEGPPHHVGHDHQHLAESTKSFAGGRVPAVVLGPIHVLVRLRQKDVNVAERAAITDQRTTYTEGGEVNERKIVYLIILLWQRSVHGYCWKRRQRILRFRPTTRLQKIYHLVVIDDTKIEASCFLCTSHYHPYENKIHQQESTIAKIIVDVRPPL